VCRFGNGLRRCLWRFPSARVVAERENAADFGSFAGIGQPVILTLLAIRGLFQWMRSCRRISVADRIRFRIEFVLRSCVCVCVSAGAVERDFRAIYA
jgi:hypothetical protein